MSTESELDLAIGPDASRSFSGAAPHAPSRGSFVVGMTAAIALIAMGVWVVCSTFT
jgi:hypothetical protein